MKEEEEEEEEARDPTIYCVYLVSFYVKRDPAWEFCIKCVRIDKFAVRL